jgi:hypothetical protein
MIGEIDLARIGERTGEDAHIMQDSPEPVLFVARRLELAAA